MHRRNFPFHTCTVLLFTPCTAHSLLAMKSPLHPARKACSLGCWHPTSGSATVATGSHTGQGDTFAITKPNAAIKPYPLAQHLPAGSRLAAAPVPLANAPGRKAQPSAQPGLPGSEGEPGMLQRRQSRRTRSTHGSAGRCLVQEPGCTLGSWWCLPRRPAAGSLAGWKIVTPRLRPGHPSVPVCQSVGLRALPRSPCLGGSRFTGRPGCGDCTLHPGSNPQRGWGTEKTQNKAKKQELVEPGRRQHLPGSLHWASPGKGVWALQAPTLPVPLAAPRGCSTPIARDKAGESTRQAVLATLPGEEEGGGLCSHLYQQSLGSSGAPRHWGREFRDGGIVLQDGQMPWGKGTGHGSEGGTKPSKVAGKGRSTQYKGSLAEP